MKIEDVLKQLFIKCKVIYERYSEIVIKESRFDVHAEIDDNFCKVVADQSLEEIKITMKKEEINDLKQFLVDILYNDLIDYSLLLKAESANILVIISRCCDDIELTTINHVGFKDIDKFTRTFEYINE